MLAHRHGRGKDAFRRIMCYEGTPAQYVESKKIVEAKEEKIKFIHVEDITK